MKKLFLILLVIGAALVVISLFVSCETWDTSLTPEQAQVVDIIDCPGIDKARLFILANSNFCPKKAEHGSKSVAKSRYN